MIFAKKSDDCSRWVINYLYDMFRIQCNIALLHNGH